ncbi:MAG: hypothetical protein IH915_04420 [Thaumarchaeota archaeon]|nr:hypothetical protein [Nitrososphaerota archaeon]
MIVIDHPWQMAQVECLIVSLLIAGDTFEHTFDSSGTENYYCMVHPWMTGSVQVS